MIILMETGVSLVIAFTAGFLTFFTPCLLPLIPAYLSFITGFSFDQLHNSVRSKRIILINSLMFILGFSIVFVLLGASITYLGSLLREYQDWIRKAGGAIIVVFGLHLTGIFKLRFLEKEKKFHLHSKPAGYIGSLIVGVTFAVGWTPCVGPILGSILVYASSSGTVSMGIGLLIAYSLGLGIPFFLTALLTNVILRRFSKITAFIRPVSIFCGIFLIFVGVLLFTDLFKVFGRF